jgi:hypothetical protein
MLDSSGHYSPVWRLDHTSVAGPVYTTPETESLILRDTFSSVPIIWESELSQEYQELGEALNEMTELEEGDEWKIDAPVYNIACSVAAELMANSFPAPSIFNHGPKSIVFNWSKEQDNLYLTISADRISALISSPERIKRRIDISARELMNPSLAFSSVGAAYSDYSREPVKQLVKGAVPDPPELVLVG